MNVSQHQAAGQIHHGPSRIVRLVYDEPLRRLLLIAILGVLMADASGVPSLLVPETCTVEEAGTCSEGCSRHRSPCGVWSTRTGPRNTLKKP